MSRLADQDLADRMREGDHGAFKQIVRMCDAAVLYRIRLRGVRSNWVGEEDVRADVWLGIWRALAAGQFDPKRGNLKTWIGTAASHRVGALPAQESFEDIDDLAGTIESGARSQDDVVDAKRCLVKLAEDHGWIREAMGCIASMPLAHPERRRCLAPSGAGVAGT